MASIKVKDYIPVRERIPVGDLSHLPTKLITISGQEVRAIICPPGRAQGSRWFLGAAKARKMNTRGTNVEGGIGDDAARLNRTARKWNSDAVSKSKKEGF